MGCSCNGFGQKMVGEADKVPGLFEVKTEFCHCFSCACIPGKSYLIFDERTSGFLGIRTTKYRGIELPTTHERSISSACLSNLSLTCIVLFIFGISSFHGSPGEFMVFFGIGIGLFVFLLRLGLSFRHATYESASEICTAVQSPELQRMVDQHFGKDSSNSSSIEVTASVVSLNNTNDNVDAAEEGEEFKGLVV